jgi:hypothetical protein
MLARKMTELVPTLPSELNRVTCDLCHTSKIKSFNRHPEDSLQPFSGLSNETSRYPLLAYNCQSEASSLFNKAGISSSAWKMTLSSPASHIERGANKVTRSKMVLYTIEESSLL